MAELSVSIDDRLKAMEARIESSENRIAKLEELVGKESLMQELNKLWGEMQILKDEMNKPKQNTPFINDMDAMEVTAVIGCLGPLPDLQGAEQWIKDQLWYMHGPEPVEVYSKGSFSGVVSATLAPSSPSMTGKRS